MIRAATPEVFCDCSPSLFFFLGGSSQHGSMTQGIKTLSSRVGILPHGQVAISILKKSLPSKLQC